MPHSFLEIEGTSRNLFGVVQELIGLIMPQNSQVTIMCGVKKESDKLCCFVGRKNSGNSGRTRRRVSHVFHPKWDGC